MQKKFKLNIEVDFDIGSKFKAQVEQDFCKQTQVLQAAMNSYGEGMLVLQGAYLVEPGSAPNPVGRPKISKDPQVVKGTEIKPVPTVRKPHPWFDADHSKRALKDFDTFVDNVHPLTDPRPMLELRTKGETETFSDVLQGEYHDVRATCIDERNWGHMYWDFCRWCAKKFFTLNKIENLRYDQAYLEEDLLKIKSMCEDRHPAWIEWKEREDARSQT